MSNFTIKLTGRPASLKALLSGFPTANVILTLLFYVITLGRFCPISELTIGTSAQYSDRPD